MAGFPAVGGEASPGSVLPPHPSSSSPDSRNPLLWFLGELLPGGSAALAFPAPLWGGEAGGGGIPPPLRQFPPPHPETGAGMQGYGGCLGFSGLSSVEVARSRGRICFIFPVEGREIINANYSQQKQERGRKAQLATMQAKLD